MSGVSELSKILTKNIAKGEEKSLAKGLSAEQNEFFKDSVLRGEDGSLVPVYHSSPEKFTVFDDSKLGVNTGRDNTGYGHFVTPDKDFSTQFSTGDPSSEIYDSNAGGNVMKMYANVKNPITHPYMAGDKYNGEELDNIVRDYFKATDNPYLEELEQNAKDAGESLYNQYMDEVGWESPFEYSGEERKALADKGYDAVEIIEGLKNGLVEGSKDNTPVSSYAIFNSNQLKDINNRKPTSNPDILKGIIGLLGGGSVLGGVLG